MSITITGVVKSGVVVPNAPLPEGASVEIHVLPTAMPAVTGRLTPTALRRMPREARQAILAGRKAGRKTGGAKPGHSKFYSTKTGPKPEPDPNRDIVSSIRSNHQ